MNMNVEDIQKKEFHVVFKGYKPEEVDEFLDILAVEFEKMQKENHELMNRAERSKYEEDKESAEMKKIIQEALVSAHKIAEDIKMKAEREAEELVKNKVVEEEESYKKMLTRKLQLEEDIHGLERRYDNFKEKIIGLVNDFKETATKLEEGKFLDLPGIGEEESDVGGKEISEEIVEENTEEKDISYAPESEDEFEVFKTEEKSYTGAESEDESEEKTEAEDLVEDEGEIESEKDKEGEQEIKAKRGFHVGSEEIEESGEDYLPKRMKKKIDIANPDIINDFFKTDED